MASTTPDNPPNVNKKIKASANKLLGLNTIFPAYNVANHENIFIDVGTAIINVAALKYALLSVAKPIVNIWWAHTNQPNIAILTIALIIPTTPNLGFCA